jgi:hypothetical protein
MKLLHMAKLNEEYIMGCRDRVELERLQTADFTKISARLTFVTKLCDLTQHKIRSALQ